MTLLLSFQIIYYCGIKLWVFKIQSAFRLQREQATTRKITCICTLKNSKIILAIHSSSVFCFPSTIPLNQNNWFWSCNASNLNNCSDASLAAILVIPLPVGSTNHKHSKVFHCTAPEPNWIKVTLSVTCAVAYVYFHRYHKAYKLF